MTLSGFAGGQGAEEARAAARGSGNAARIRGGARPARRHRGGRRTYEACLLHGCSIIRDELLPRLPTGTISGDEFEDDDDAVGGRW